MSSAANPVGGALKALMPESTTPHLRNLDIQVTDNNMFILSFYEDYPAKSPVYPGEMDSKMRTYAYSSVNEALDHLGLVLRRVLATRSLDE